MRYIYLRLTYLLTYLLESGTDPTNRNARACLSYTLQTPTTRRDASYKLNVALEARSRD